MHAATMVQRFLDRHVHAMHGSRRRLLAAVVGAVMAGHWIGISRLGRGLAQSSSVKSAIKRVDRLIGSPRITAEAQQIGAALLACIGRMSATLVIAVDWSAAAPGGAFVELRAAVTWPGAGRALPVYQRVYPLHRLGDPQAEQALLRCLQAWIPADKRVIVVTDAGFRRPWFNQVSRLGWAWIGRVRQGVSLSQDRRCWMPVADWFDSATSQARRIPSGWLARKKPMPCAIVLYRRRRQGRKQWGVQGQPRSTKAAREARLREREPWLLVHSPQLSEYRPDEIVSFYARRMQIEESFRDSKSPAFGMGFRIGRSRSAERLQALLLIATVAAFMLWHIGQLAEAEGLQRRFRSTTRTAREISIITLALLLCQGTGPPLSPTATQALERRLAL
jgi:hypothetical protein